VKNTPYVIIICIIFAFWFVNSSDQKTGKLSDGTEFTYEVKHDNPVPTNIAIMVENSTSPPVRIHFSLRFPRCYCDPDSTIVIDNYLTEENDGTKRWISFAIGDDFRDDVCIAIKPKKLDKKQIDSMLVTYGEEIQGRYLAEIAEAAGDTSVALCYVFYHMKHAIEEWNISYKTYPDINLLQMIFDASRGDYEHPASLKDACLQDCTSLREQPTCRHTFI